MAAMSMSKEEIETFLSVPRMARMATTGSNGKPLGIIMTEQISL